MQGFPTIRGRDPSRFAFPFSIRSINSSILLPSPICPLEIKQDHADLLSIPYRIKFAVVVRDDDGQVNELSSKTQRHSVACRAEIIGTPSLTLRVGIGGGLLAAFVGENRALADDDFALRDLKARPASFGAIRFAAGSDSS